LSTETVPLAYRVIDAFNRRDLADFLALMDPGVEAQSRLAVIEGDYHGHEGTRRWWANILDAMPDLTVEVEDVQVRGNFTVARLCLAFSGPRPTLRSALWHVAQWRDQKVVWWSAHQTEGEALEAVAMRL
jgi:hypothetical protein